MGRSKPYARKLFTLPIEESDPLLNEMALFCEWFGEKYASALAREGVKEGELRALKVLNQGETTAGRVARALEQSYAQTSKLLSGFNKRQWITIGKGKDHRIRQVMLTEAGRSLLERCQGQLRHLIERIMERIEAGERGGVLGQLQRLNQTQEGWHMELADSGLNGPMKRKWERKARRPVRKRKMHGGIEAGGGAEVEVKI